jgi:hypothetical protein
MSNAPGVVYESLLSVVQAEIQSLHDNEPKRLWCHVGDDSGRSMNTRMRDLLIGFNAEHVSNGPRAGLHAMTRRGDAFIAHVLTT